MRESFIPKSFQEKTLAVIHQANAIHRRVSAAADQAHVACDIGDHDPSGWQMTDDIAKRLDLCNLMGANKTTFDFSQIDEIRLSQGAHKSAEDGVCFMEMAVAR